MKKLVVVMLFLSILTSSLSIAETFSFRDNITWGMSSEVVQYYEGTTKLHKEDMFSWLKYHDIRVSNIKMALEYQFVGNKLSAIVYTTEKEYKEKEAQQLKDLCDSLYQAYQERYGKAKYTDDELMVLMKEYYEYLTGIEVPTEALKTLIDNGPSLYNLKTKDAAIVFYVSGEQKKKETVCKLNIQYIDNTIIESKNDLTGI